MGIIDYFKKKPAPVAVKKPENSTQKGTTTTAESMVKQMYREMSVDTDLKSTIMDIRGFDKTDGRVKKIHKRMARDCTKGGVRIKWHGKENARVNKIWNDLRKRMQWDKRQKLLSDARGCCIEGNLALQWVVGGGLVIKSLRMPTETIIPQALPNGQIKNIESAYVQVDPITQEKIAAFHYLQLSLTRLDPENHDDFGSMGRPYLDGVRETLLKLRMTEEDMVVRRRTRAPQKLVHVLEGAKDEELEIYEKRNASKVGEVREDYYMNKKGGVTAISGDANLDQVRDVMHLLDTFFAGGPAPKGLFGYVDGLSRDVLEDLLRDYYEEIDGLQDTISYAYYEGLRLELMLHNLNPDAYDFSVVFSERQTSSPNQRADLALKHQALGIPSEMLWETVGYQPSTVLAKIKEQNISNEPYPNMIDDDDDDDDDENDKGKPKVSITPGNAPKKESATSITNE